MSPKDLADFMKTEQVYIFALKIGVLENNITTKKIFFF